MDFSPPGSSILGMLQARVLEWGAISFSRGSSQPRNRTRVSHIVGRRFTIWTTREVQGGVEGQPKATQSRKKWGVGTRVDDERVDLETLLLYCFPKEGKAHWGKTREVSGGDDILILKFPCYQSLSMKASLKNEQRCFKEKKNHG